MTTAAITLKLARHARRELQALVAPAALVETQEDGSAVFSVELNDLSVELKQAFRQYGTFTGGVNVDVTILPWLLEAYGDLPLEGVSLEHMHAEDLAAALPNIQLDHDQRTFASVAMLTVTSDTQERRDAAISQLQTLLEIAFSVRKTNVLVQEESIVPVLAHDVLAAYTCVSSDRSHESVLEDSDLPAIQVESFAVFHEAAVVECKRRLEQVQDGFHHCALLVPASLPLATDFQGVHAFYLPAVEDLTFGVDEEMEYSSKIILQPQKESEDETKQVRDVEL
jgi:hypothetical protein